MADANPAAQPDVTLRLDGDGVIREVTLSRAFAEESAQTWLGRHWIDTVGEFGGDKVRRMIEDAQATGVSAFRQITQCFPSGLELPMEYTAVRLGDKSGLVAVGKNLQVVSELQSRLVSAQIAMERDYWKLRELETRYRLLFDASNDAVILLRAADLHVVEANPAAIRALGVAPLERDFLDELAPEERATFQAMLARAREHGRSPAIVVHVGSDRQSWVVRASLMTGELGQVFLLQLAKAGAPLPHQVIASAGLPHRGDEASDVGDLLERMPDGFVVADRGGVVLRANRAFCDLVEAASVSAVIGKRLRRWLCRPGADVSILLSGIANNRFARGLATSITSEFGLETKVEISGAGDSDANPQVFGLLVRDVTQHVGAVSGGRPLAPRLDGIVDTIGAKSLQDAVKQTTEAVERRCIEAALGRSGGNRTVAAADLGLSRQSLYVKMNRYGIDNDHSKHVRHNGG